MELIQFLLHLDDQLINVIQILGPWTYVFIFGIIFAETGLVVTPFLPGDSLLFIVGTLSGNPVYGLNIWVMYAVLLTAAILGDTVNYWAGHFIGPRVFTNKNSRIFKQEYLSKTSAFYQKHGGKTIILARFIPIVRTFAPFVAGVGKMHYATFFIYNIVGAFIWVTALLFAGYFFGSHPFIKNNFEFMVIGIILISLLPMLIEYINHKKTATKSPKDAIEDVKKVIKKENLD